MEETASDPVYYRSSGIIPVASAALALLLTLVASLVLGLVYGIVAYINPFIYIAVVGAGLFGLTLGQVAGFSYRTAKIRNEGFLFWLVAISFCAGIYSSYVSFGAVATQWNLIPIAPQEFWAVFQTILGAGLWGIGNWVPTGWALAAFWIVELAVIGVTCFATGHAVQNPFCEPCGRWTVPVERNYPLGTDDVGRLQLALEHGRFDVVQAFAGQHGMDDTGLEARFHKCANCEASDYLTVSQVIVRPRKNGESERTERVVISMLNVPRSLTDLMKTLPLSAEAAAMSPDAPAIS